MLSKLTINNVALIEHIEIDFSSGLNVLSGETGAGKSLIIDSISLLLGERADKTLISIGKQSAFVEAVFTNLTSGVISVLSSFGIDDISELIISRKITVDGKNECRVNGQTFTLFMLKKVTSLILDLHGQFQHQSLLNPETHIEILDEFNKERISPLKEQFNIQLEKYNGLKKELSAFTVDEKEREQLIDLFRFQINEIEEANFKAGEIEDLQNLQIKFSHAEKIKHSLDNVLGLLADENNGGALNSLARAQNCLKDVVGFDSKLSELGERIGSAKIELEDISSTLSDYLDQEDYSASEVERVNDRLDLFSNFKKKYGASVEEINAYLSEIKDKFEKLNNCSETVNKLLAQKNEAEECLLKIGTKLNDERIEISKEFSSKVIHELNEVGLNGSKFVVSVNLLDLENANSNGLSAVEFMFSANVGQPPKPISKVISGGEMSRFMLALKSITADKQNISTMIFDEIDTGVSGEMAKVLALKMFKIGQTHQVLCVTHMAQICALASANYFISKSVLNGQTKTQIKRLNRSEKVKEVARLIGNSESASALTHAQEMIDLTNQVLN